MNRGFLRNRRGQLTFFIILAVLIVGIIVLFFAFRSGLFGSNIPVEFRPIYDTYSSCISDDSSRAVDFLGTHGGRIDLGDYAPGSEFAPFSSHLNFVGISIPYWYYVSGNGVISENLPSKSDMEKEMETYLEEDLKNCDFSEFTSQGFYIDLEINSVKVSILENSVDVVVDSDLVVQKEDRSARKSSHEVSVSSNMGDLYNSAVAIYNYEKDSLFLENYAVDVLQGYAPVDGVEIQCSPKIWKTPEVVQGIKEGLQSNIGAIKLKGDYYTLNSEDDNYFVKDIGNDLKYPVSFHYLNQEFPSKIEVTPASNALMVAEPVGNQEGLGVMGFCYVPYHFVYDISFPVLVQVGNGEEIFQFPLSVIVDNNFPRSANLSNIVEEPESDVCSFAEGDVNVGVYDSNLNPIEADISYNCFSDLCSLGRTSITGQNSVLNSKIPICVNGYLIANADGYKSEKILFSSNSETAADLILEKEYSVNVNVNIGGNGLGNNGTAVVHFVKEDGSGSVSALIPDSSNVKLTEGLYNISVFAYGSSNIVIPSNRKRECYETSRGGLAGILGSTKEECIDVEIPEVKIDHALIGGGKTTSYILTTDLESGQINLEISELPKPNSLEQLQYNFEAFNTLGVYVDF